MPLNTRIEYPRDYPPSPCPYFCGLPHFITLLLLKSAGDLSAERFEGGHREILLLPGEIYLGGDNDAAQHKQEKNCYVDAGIAGLSLTILILQTKHR